MKPAFSILMVIFLVGSCADPGSITNPIVENPRPVEIAITAEHLDESNAEDRLSTGDQQEVPLTTATDMTSMWANALDRSYVVLDTVTNRILGFRLSLIPSAAHRDTLLIMLRRVVIELDSNAGIVIGPREYRFNNGEAMFVIRLTDGRRIFYRTLPVDQRNPAVPSDLLDEIYCKLQVWRSIQRKLIIRIALQLYVRDEQGGQQKIRRLRASALCQVPLP